MFPGRTAVLEKRRGKREEAKLKSDGQIKKGSRC